jgi:hypothetical protein
MRAVQSRFNQWYVQFVQPVADAYFAYDLDAARVAYDTALGSLAGVESDDEREARRLRLETSWFMVLSELGDPAQAQPVFQQLVSDCHAATANKAARMAKVCELLVCLRADHRGIADVKPEEAAALAEAVPEEMRGPHYWHELANWAFRHGDSELLEEAFAFFTVQRVASMADWLYARLQLMRRLHHRRATEQDVRQAISRIEVRVELDDFSQMLRPACEEQGLMSAVVLRELEAKQLEMEESGKRRPRRGG